MPLSESPADFLERYNLPSEAFETTGLEWDELLRIHDHHETNLSSLEVHARSIVDQLRSISEVHSLRYRIKSPEHLVEKIIRKKLKKSRFRGHSGHISGRHYRSNRHSSSASFQRRMAAYTRLCLQNVGDEGEADRQYS